MFMEESSEHMYVYIDITSHTTEELAIDFFWRLSAIVNEPETRIPTARQACLESLAAIPYWWKKRRVDQMLKDWERDGRKSFQPLMTLKDTCLCGQKCRKSHWQYV